MGHTVGVTFSPEGDYAYVSDTGINRGFWGYNFSEPASMYVLRCGSRQAGLVS